MNGLNEEQIVEALRREDYRVTQPRRAVIRVLLEDDGFATPPEIREQAMEYCPGIGQVTVYRTLDLLSRLGFVRRIHTEEGCHGRVSARLGHRHHLICRQCGAAVEFEGCNLSSFLTRVSGETGYLIEGHMLELVGLCPECR